MVKSEPAPAVVGSSPFLRLLESYGTMVGILCLTWVQHSQYDNFFPQHLNNLFNCVDWILSQSFRFGPCTGSPPFSFCFSCLPPPPRHSHRCLTLHLWDWSWFQRDDQPLNDVAMWRLIKVDQLYAHTIASPMTARHKSLNHITTHPRVLSQLQCCVNTIHTHIDTFTMNREKNNASHCHP